MAQIIDFQAVRTDRADRTARTGAPALFANQCCSRCGADVWHVRENGEIYCADCEQDYPLKLQVGNEY